jgi:hypothetical protein
VGLLRSLHELDVVVNASAELHAMSRSHSQDSLVLDFSHLGQVRHFDLKVRSKGTTPSLVVAPSSDARAIDILLCLNTANLPNALTELRVSGRIQGLCGHQHTLSSVQRLTAVKGNLEGMISGPCLAKLVTHMPALTLLHVTGSLYAMRHFKNPNSMLDGPCELGPAQAQQLADAIGSATALTSLSFMG